MLSGCSTDGPDVVCVVYEYMVNGSLKDRLECRDGTPVLSWHRRQSILKDAAAGLQYLHTVDTKPLVHGNFKSSNILLGSHFEAKIADFGLAKECTGGSTAGQFTHATVQHTANLFKLHAYLPKEFHMGNQKYSVTTDIYSFGVVIYETCTGMRVYEPDRKDGELLSDYVQFVVDNNSSNLYRLKDDRCFDWPKSVWLQLMSFGQQCTASKQKARPAAADIHLRLEKLIMNSVCTVDSDGKQSSGAGIRSQQQDNTAGVDTFVASFAGCHQNHKLPLNLQRQQYIPVTLDAIPSVVTSNDVTAQGSCCNTTTAFDHKPVGAIATYQYSGNLMDFSASSLSDQIDQRSDVDQELSVCNFAALNITSQKETSPYAASRLDANNEACDVQQYGMDRELINDYYSSASLSLQTESTSPDVHNTDADMASMMEKLKCKQLPDFVSNLFNNDDEPIAELLPTSVPTTKQSMAMQANGTLPVYRQANMASAGSSVSSQPVSASSRPGLATEDYGRAEKLERLKASLTAFCNGSS